MSETLPTKISQSVSIYNQSDANHMFSLAKQFSKSSLVPKHFQNKPEDCFIGLQLAQRMGADPFMVLQNLYVVHGRPGFSAQFLIAMANQSGVFDGPIMFRTEGTGDKMSVTAYAKHAQSGDEVHATVGMAMAKAEGWSRNPKYQTMPELMLSYRSATFLIRMYAPQVTMGLHTVEEIRDITHEVEVHDANPKNDALDRAREAGVYDESMEKMTAKQIDDEILFREDNIAREREDAREQALEASVDQGTPKSGSSDSNDDKAPSAASEGTQGDLL